MKERENLSAGIYAAVVAALFLICLIDAFAFPPRISVSKGPGIFALIAFLVGIPILLRLAHRDRIRDEVLKAGGTLVRIKQLPIWRQRFTVARYVLFMPVKYEVEYIDPLGATHRALCNSGFFQGVEWLNDDVVDPGPWYSELLIRD